MTGRAWAYTRIAGAVVVLGVIIERLGSGPFLTGLKSVSGASLAAVGGITAVTTACCAWRWCLVARGLGVPIRFGTAFAGYYRSQFLNTALPGGILGDIHRGARHGRDAGDLGRGLRAVAWERIAGQAVQVVVAVAVLTLAPSPVRATMPIVLLIAAGCVAVIVAAVRMAPSGSSSRAARAGRAVVADVRAGVVASERWPTIVCLSLVAIVGHTASFLIAARAVGSPASLGQLLPLSALILLAAAVPLNVGGWGPREGVAAWAFASAGLGAGPGVAVGTAFGVLVAAASLPGAVVLLAGWLARRRDGRPADAATAPSRPDLVGAGARSTGDG